MTYTYSITGMTCGGCVAKVKSELLKLPDVTGAEVQLQSPQATISMQRYIPDAALLGAIQKAGAKYTMAPSEGVSPATTAQQAAEEGNSYLPIMLIFAYITGVSLIIQAMRGGFDAMEWMRHFMGGFFLVFSFFKMMNLRGFAEGYRSYDLLAKAFPAYGLIYPFVELTLGIAFITGFQPFLTNAVTLAAMLLSTVGVVQSLMKGSTVQCACLGTAIKLPLGRVTLFEDALMAVMSAVMLIMLR